MKKPKQPEYVMYSAVYDQFDVAPMNLFDKKQLNSLEYGTVIQIQIEKMTGSAEQLKTVTEAVEHFNACGFIFLGQL